MSRGSPSAASTWKILATFWRQAQNTFASSRPFSTRRTLPKPARNSGKGWVKIRLALEIGVNLEFLFARDRQNFVGFGQSAAIYFQKMTSDLDLLRQFARENSQDDFTEIVRRHVNLVYSAALRQVRSPQLAEEIAQSVFADLARDANKLKPDTIVTAWLYSVTRRTAIDVIRKESRRQLREQIAVEMNNMNATESRTGVRLSGLKSKNISTTRWPRSTRPTAPRFCSATLKIKTCAK